MVEEWFIGNLLIWETAEKNIAKGFGLLFEFIESSTNKELILDAVKPQKDGKLTLFSQGFFFRPWAWRGWGNLFASPLMHLQKYLGRNCVHVAIWHWRASVIETAIVIFNIFVNNKLIPGLDFGENHTRVFDGFFNTEELCNRKKTLIRY